MKGALSTNGAAFATSELTCPGLDRLLDPHSVGGTGAMELRPHLTYHPGLCGGSLHFPISTAADGCMFCSLKEVNYIFFFVFSSLCFLLFSYRSVEGYCLEGCFPTATCEDQSDGKHHTDSKNNPMQTVKTMKKSHTAAGKHGWEGEQCPTLQLLSIPESIKPQTGGQHRMPYGGTATL